jgi:hypothetical protein
MPANIKLSGTALLTSGVIDLQDVATIVVTIVKAEHSFKLQPAKEGEEGWRVTITLDLQDSKSLMLLQELRNSGRFSN